MGCHFLVPVLINTFIIHIIVLVLLLSLLLLVAQSGWVGTPHCGSALLFLSTRSADWITAAPCRCNYLVFIIIIIIIIKGSEYGNSVVNTTIVVVNMTIVVVNMTTVVVNMTNAILVVIMPIMMVYMIWGNLIMIFLMFLMFTKRKEKSFFCAGYIHGRLY